MLSESVHHLVLPSVIAWTTKFVSTTNVLQGAQETINALSSMNAEEVFASWLKNVDLMMIAPSLKLVQLPFPTLAKENVKMSAVDLSFVEGMRCVKPAVTDLFVLVLKASLATLKMIKLAVKRNFVQPIQTVLEIAFVWISDVLLHSDQAVQLTENVVPRRSVSMVIVSILVTILLIAVSMLAAQFTITRSNVHALKDLLATLKLNVSGSPIHACQPSNVQVV